MVEDLFRQYATEKGKDPDAYWATWQGKLQEEEMETLDDLRRSFVPGSTTWDQLKAPSALKDFLRAQLMPAPGAASAASAVNKGPAGAPAAGPAQSAPAEPAAAEQQPQQTTTTPQPAAAAQPIDAAVESLFDFVSSPPNSTGEAAPASPPPAAVQEQPSPSALPDAKSAVIPVAKAIPVRQPQQPTSAGAGDGELDEATLRAIAAAELEQAQMMRLSQQEQADADLAMAMAMQEEEMAQFGFSRIPCAGCNTPIGVPPGVVAGAQLACPHCKALSIVPFSTTHRAMPPQPPAARAVQQLQYQQQQPQQQQQPRPPPSAAAGGPMLDRKNSQPNGGASMMPSIASMPSMPSMSSMAYSMQARLGKYLPNRHMCTACQRLLGVPKGMTPGSRLICPYCGVTQALGGATQPPVPASVAPGARGELSEQHAHLVERFLDVFKVFPDLDAAKVNKVLTEQGGGHKKGLWKLARTQYADIIGKFDQTFLHSYLFLRDAASAQSLANIAGPPLQIGYVGGAETPSQSLMLLDVMSNSMSGVGSSGGVVSLNLLDLRAQRWDSQLLPLLPPGPPPPEDVSCVSHSLMLPGGTEKYNAARDVWEHDSDAKDVRLFSVCVGGASICELWQPNAAAKRQQQHSERTSSAKPPIAYRVTPTTPMLVERAACAVLPLRADLVVAIGGVNSQGKDLDSVEMYSMRTKLWHQLPPLRSKRAHPCALSLQSGELLVLGGVKRGLVGQQTYLKGVEALVHDGQQQNSAKWVTRTPMKDARVFCGVVEALPGQLLVAGGRNQAGALSSVEMLDVKSGVWRKLRSMSCAKDRCRAFRMANGDVLVMGIASASVTVAGHVADEGGSVSSSSSSSSTSDPASSSSSSSSFPESTVDDGLAALGFGLRKDTAGSGLGAMDAPLLTTSLLDGANGPWGPGVTTEEVVPAVVKVHGRRNEDNEHGGEAAGGAEGAGQGIINMAQQTSEAKSGGPAEGVRLDIECYSVERDEWYRLPQTVLPCPFEGPPGSFLLDNLKAPGSILLLPRPLPGQ